MGYITQLTDGNQENIFPITLTDAVKDASGNTLTSKLEVINEDVTTYDVSYHNNGQSYSLAGAIAATPNEYKHAGIKLRFISDSTSGYTEYACVTSAFTESVSGWTNVDQFSTGEYIGNVGIDDEPTSSSENLVKSGGVEKYLAKEITTVENPEYIEGAMAVNGVVNTSATSYGYFAPILLKSGETIILNNGNAFYHGGDVASVYKCDSTGTFEIALVSTPYTVSVVTKYSNNSGSDIYVGISGYKSQLKYKIETLVPAASQSDVDVLYDRTNVLADGVDDVPTYESQKLVKSGGIKSYIDSTIDNAVTTFGEKIGSIVNLCVKRTGGYVTSNGASTGSSNYDYYAYKINGETKLYVRTKEQYSNTVPAYVLFSTDSVGTEGYISHVNWNVADNGYVIDIPSNCKMITVNVYRPSLEVPFIGVLDGIYSFLKEKLNENDRLTSILGKILVDGVVSGTKIDNKFINVNGTPVSTVSGAYYYKFDNKNYKEIFAYLGYDDSTVTAIAFYNGEVDSSTLISRVPFSSNTNVNRDARYHGVVPEGTTVIAVGVNSRFVGNEEILIVQDIDKYYDDISSLKEDVDDINDEIDVINEAIENIGDTVNIPGDGSATAVKEIVNSDRPYYFSQGWSSEDSFGYLDDRLSLVPKGKHFLVYTDIHLDYYNNFGLRQKQSMVMKYVQKRLRDCSVIFLGDFIGMQATELAAQKEMSWFANDNYSKFGDKFVPVLGDHDTDMVGGGLPQGSQLTEEYIYETYFKQAHIYGAVQDRGISVIDTIVFSEDATVNATKRVAWKNYMRMHFYKDDAVNKIRFISLQATGATFRTTPNLYNTPRIQIPFICDAIKTAPDDYDIIIVAHEYQIKTDGTPVSSVWEREMFKALTAFRTRGNYTISRPSSTSADDTLVWDAVISLYDSTYNYSSKTGKVAVLQGDNHFDGANYYNADDNISNSIGFGYEPSSKDVLRIYVDRSILVEDNGFPTSTYTNPLDVVRMYRRAVAQRGDVVLLGTTDEVLFDVVTINNDGLTLTRFGDQPVAGRIGLYPIFSEEESYAIGDRVVYYETIGNAYFPKAFVFTSAHTPGTFDLSEVEEFVVTEPYIRNYLL